MTKRSIVQEVPQAKVLEETPEERFGRVLDRALRIVDHLADCEHRAPGIVEVDEGRVRWCDRFGAIDLSGTGRGFVPSAAGGRARKLVSE